MVKLETVSSMKTKEEIAKHLAEEVYTDSAAEKIFEFLEFLDMRDEDTKFRRAKTYMEFVEWWESGEEEEEEWEPKCKWDIEEDLISAREKMKVPNDLLDKLLRELFNDKK